MVIHNEAAIYDLPPTLDAIDLSAALGRSAAAKHVYAMGNMSL